MIHVITNSRRYATDKLMSRYGLKAPFTSVRFVEKTVDLPRPPASALLIWQRGRNTPDAHLLRTLAESHFKAGSYRSPTKLELKGMSNA